MERRGPQASAAVLKTEAAHFDASSASPAHAPSSPRAATAKTIATASATAPTTKSEGAPRQETGKSRRKNQTRGGAAATAHVDAVASVEGRAIHPALPPPGLHFPSSVPREAPPCPPGEDKYGPDGNYIGPAPGAGPGDWDTTRLQGGEFVIDSKDSDDDEDPFAMFQLDFKNAMPGWTDADSHIASVRFRDAAARCR